MSKWPLNSALLMDTLFEPISASKRRLQSAVAKERPALEMGPPYFDGQYIDLIALESANDVSDSQ